MNMLVVKALTKRFGGLVAVSNADVEAREGEITALIGPNGAGKTTLFACIAGFLRPDAGTVHFMNENIVGRWPHEICRMGMVRTFQIVKPFGALSVVENVMAGAYLRHPGSRDALEHATNVATRVGLSHHLDRRASDLTVAGRKRLELARALATGPKLLLLDEVMAGLTPSEIDEIIPVIRSIRDDNVTIVLIEHVMRAVSRLADTTFVLNEGAVVASGRPQDVMREPQVIDAYLGRQAAALLSDELDR